MMHAWEASIRKATVADIDHVAALGEAEGTSVRWNHAHYLEVVNEASSSKRVLLVAEGSEKQEGIVGFIVAQSVGDEWEIENVVVSPIARKKGVGHTLLASIVQAARREHATRVQLEVRASNAAAIALYRKFGFQQDGLRKAYYSNPEEDALLFSLSLKNSS